ncbi:MAG: tRNA (adenosine(37)-N6)-dimethylallyltransferase MiaA [Candidatus Nitronauta litoralis]|uniref:tRNA dimethylallyltransferase n=1 Tax=Candidatus Nitronauta litoralis TaxID=2705533 RepID=A0A7T0BWM0_9BACT|nr:MAG: tRNA (adenosine(37)-N6)-dimethylallyltransferase MiaA [Candidatus Nitronauta litoralis]
MNPLIILAGPTATGKSETAVELAETLNTEIISADSMQVYKHFDIGTAKPSAELRARVKHHLIDSLEPHEEFTAHDFKQRAETIIHGLHQKSRIPVLAGGTGLYLKVLMENFECGEAADPELRNRIRKEIKLKGPEAMHAELVKVDPVGAERIKPTDPSRIERALTVFYQTGNPLSQYHEKDSHTFRNYDVHLFVLTMDRTRLYEAVNKRVDQMIKKGWLGEVRDLQDQGIPETCKPFQGIGYAQLNKVIKHQMDLEDAVEDIKRETRRYAKRQITWFKKSPGAQTIEVGPKETPRTLKTQILAKLSGTISAVAALSVLALFLVFPVAKSWAGQMQDAARYLKYKKPKAACEALKPLVSNEANTPQGIRAGFLMGRCLSKQKKYKEATTYFQKSLTALPELEDYTRLELAKINLALGSAKSAFEETSYLLQNFPQSRIIPQAEQLRARALHGLGQTEQAIFFLEEAIARLTGKKAESDFAQFIPELILQAGRLQETEKLPSRAYLNYRKIFVEHPNHESAKVAEKALKRIVRSQALKPPSLTERELNKRVSRLFKSARYKEALRELNAYKNEMGNRKLPVEWYFNMAKAYNGVRKRQLVVSILKEFIKIYPNHGKLQQARFKIGRTLWNLGHDGEAKKYFRKVLETTSKNSWKATSRFYLGRLHENSKQYDPAKKYYSELLAMGGSSSYLEKAAWRLGWIAFRTKNFGEGIKQFQKNIERWPGTIWTAKNLFWLAKLNELSGKKLEALKTFATLLEQFPYTYYGVRAEEKVILLKQELPANTVPRMIKTGFTSPGESPKGLNRSLTEQENFHYTRAITLSEMGLYDEARLEARKAVSTLRKNLSGVLWASDLYIKSRAYPEAMRVLYMYRDYKQPAGEKDLPVAFWKNFFPLAYFDLIKKPAAAYSVDPFFVDGLIRQESLFDDDIVSPAGARGLMQIMPETGRRLYSAGKGDTSYDPETLFDARVNVSLGIKFLGQLTERFGNKGMYLLISYNAGPHVLEKWLKRFAHIRDEDVFIESIPYPETRGYVKRVMRNYGIYRRLYSDAASRQENNRVF